MKALGTIAWRCWSESCITLEIPWYFICQSHGISAIDSYTWGAEIFQEREVCYRKQSWGENCLSRSRLDKRYGNRSFPCWISVLLWSRSSSLWPHPFVFECYCIFYAIVCWKYIICLLTYGITFKKLLWVSEESLKHGLLNSIKKCGRLWSLMTVDYIYFFHSDISMYHELSEPGNSTWFFFEWGWFL